MGTEARPLEILRGRSFDWRGSGELLLREREGELGRGLGSPGWLQRGVLQKRQTEKKKVQLYRE